MTKTAILAETEKTGWFSRPTPDHLVHFYPHNDELVISLIEYISTGLNKGETCAVIATPNILIRLNKGLRLQGINVAEVMASNQYITYDADQLLSKFMVNESPDLDSFLRVVGHIISLASGRGKPVRAFGEMVAILLKRGNLNGLIKLEQYWEDLIHQHSFSLYCAYPETAFKDTPQHQDLIDDICDCHALTAGSPIPA